MSERMIIDFATLGIETIQGYHTYDAYQNMTVKNDVFVFVSVMLSSPQT